MQHQLHDRLKRAILDGSLVAGSRLPGSRALAEALAAEFEVDAGEAERDLVEFAGVLRRAFA